MRKYSLFRLLVQKLAVTRFGSWYFANTQHHLDLLFFRNFSRKHTATKILAGLPVVMVTTHGAKSGEIRTSPLLYVRTEPDAEEFAVVASNWGRAPYPAWCFNLRVNPNAECDIEGVTRKYVSHEATGEEYDRYRAAASVTYIGFPKYYERLADHRSIPIFVLRPAD